MGNPFGGGTADKLTGGSKKANKSNKANLAQIKAMFDQLNTYGEGKYGEALKSIEGIGAASKANALSQENQYLAHSKQSLGGLYNSTVANSAARGIHSDTMRVLGGIDEDIARMRAGLLTGQAGYRQSNVMGLGNILGGFQYQPGTNYLAELMKIGGSAAMFCDRRLKNILALVDVAFSRDGTPFGIYRFTYKMHPEAGVFEGVIAQEVRHIPGVVLQTLSGHLLVDAEKLYELTGVEIKHIGSGVPV